MDRLRPERRGTARGTRGHPRPQLVRPGWQSLDGPWEFFLDREGLIARPGEVRWDRFLAALYQAGYDGCVVIEHEDRGFEGSDDKVKAGFLLARNTVAPYVV